MSTYSGTRDPSNSVAAPIVTIPTQSAAELAAGRVDAPLAEVLHAGLQGGHWRRHGLVRFGGLAVDAPATSRSAVTAISMNLGRLLPQDAAGALVREVRYRGVRTGQGPDGRYSDSNEGGQLHTDGPHRVGTPPDIFALLCVRQASSGGALVTVEHAEVVNLLTPQTRALLAQNWYFDRREPGSSPLSHPILTWPDGRPQLRYLRSYVEQGEREGRGSLTSERAAALDLIDAAIEQARSGGATLTQEPGELLLVDNRRLLHGRTPFDVGHSNSARLLLRTWIELPA